MTLPTFGAITARFLFGSNGKPQDLFASSVVRDKPIQSDPLLRSGVRRVFILVSRFDKMRLPYVVFLTSLSAILVGSCTTATSVFYTESDSERDVMRKSEKDLWEKSCKILPGYNPVSPEEVIRILHNNTIKLLPYIPDESGFTLLKSPVEFLLTDGTHQILGQRVPYFGKYTYDGKFLSTHIGNSQHQKRKHGLFLKDRSREHYVLKFKNTKFCEFLDVELLSKE
ncbi:MAG: hypothetical protein ABI668_00920 [Sphingorhabdus sp.]